MGLFRTAVPQAEQQINVTVQVPTNGADEVSKRVILSEDAFMAMLYLERRRAERGRKRYVLVLVDVEDAISNKNKARTVGLISKTLCSVARETDITGWYVYDHIMGVIATEIGDARSSEVRARISQKLRAAFLETLGADMASLITLSFHFFPDEVVDGDNSGSVDNAHYPELSRTKTSRKLALEFKRVMDITGSALALIVLSPLFAIIALVIKATSEGPVLFRAGTPGPERQEILVPEVPLHAHELRQQDSPGVRDPLHCRTSRICKRGRERPDLQDPKRPARHSDRQYLAQDEPR